ncbi:sporulation protein YqfD [uncultured Clostridium sp.]|uniref:sporulation protein YqfD n=1 Tax=uncultured Clostridium sp. TaxID=59620 RepID=UPI0025D5D96C|nr:sporulation protein YqfD [uncultured Clostridium sp.]
MMFNKLLSGKLIIEVKALKCEKILNTIWNKHILINKVVKLDLTTIMFQVDYSDYRTVEEIVKKHRGKIKVVSKEGIVFKLIALRKKISLALGIVIFLGVIYSLSNYIWAIDIETKENLTPFEARRELYYLGIKPGMKKSDINVYEIERKMQTANDQIMWIRTRIEGSTLHLVIEEKINPPDTEIKQIDSVIAKCDGEVQRVYTYSGNPAVNPGDIVKEGDVLIYPVQGREGFEVETKPKGKIIANTFYEKYMEVQVSGEKLEKSGNKQKDIYISLGGKKIYLKKAINKFTYCDKIEENKGVFYSVTYFEKKAVKVNKDKDEIIEDSSQKLQQSLEKSLSNDAKIINKDVTSEDIGEGKILVRVIFTVEQDIAKNIS